MIAPQLEWQSNFSLTINDLQWLGEGDCCRCYCLNQRYALRIANHTEAAQALNREMYLLPSLSNALTLAIPQIQGWGIEQASGQRFVCYPLLEGTPLERETIEGLEAESQLRFVKQIAQFFQELHTVPLDIGLAAGLPMITFQDDYPALLQQAKKPLQNLGPRVWRYYSNLVAEYGATPALYSPAILHGDLSPDHCLGDEAHGRLTSIIDFGDSCIGDPLRDFMYVLEDYGPVLLNQILGLYAPETASQAARIVRLHQEINTIEYYLGQQATGEPLAIEEAALIVTQQVKE